MVIWNVDHLPVLVSIRHSEYLRKKKVCMLYIVMLFDGFC